MNGTLSSNTELEYFNGKMEEFERRLTAQVSFGVPIDIDSAGNVTGQHTSEMRGSWVTLTITNGAGTATCTHNLNIPTTSVTGAGDTANLPNVRWLNFGHEYGDRTGATATPAAPANYTIEFMKLSDGAVTANSIDLVYDIGGFTPSATEPLYVTLFFVPAVR